MGFKTPIKPMLILIHLVPARAERVFVRFWALRAALLGGFSRQQPEKRAVGRRVGAGRLERSGRLDSPF